MDKNPRGTRDFSLLPKPTDRLWNSVLGVRWSERDINHSHPSYEEVKNEWNYAAPSPLCLCDLNRTNVTFTVYSVHIPTSHLLEIHPNIIHPSTPRSPQSPFLRFPRQDPIPPLSSPIRATCPAHLILSPAQYWVSSTNHLATRYAVSSIPPLPRPS